MLKTETFCFHGLCPAQRLEIGLYSQLKIVIFDVESVDCLLIQPYPDLFCLQPDGEKRSREKPGQNLLWFLPPASAAFVAEQRNLA
jgi:hypothetical protein